FTIPKRLFTTPFWVFTIPKPVFTMDRNECSRWTETRNQRLVRWVEVEPDHIARLAREVRIAAQLEVLGTMRLQSVRTPDAVHHRRTHPLCLRHRAHAPVGGVLRRRVQRGMHDRINLLGSDQRLATRT